jgi:hypothetical protein
VLGQGGLLDTGIGIISDLEAIATGKGGLAQALGAVQKAGTAYNTFKGKNIKSIARADAAAAAQQLIRQDLPQATRSIINKNNGAFFPNPPKQTTGAAGFPTTTR